MQCGPSQFKDLTSEGGMGDSENRVILAGNVRFPEREEGTVGACDFQDAVFEKINNLFSEIDQGNLPPVLTLFDQKGPWQKFFPTLGRNALRKNYNLRRGVLDPRYANAMENSPFLSNIDKDEHFFLPEEKARFTIVAALNRVHRENGDIFKFSLEDRIIQPKSFEEDEGENEDRDLPHDFAQNDFAQMFSRRYSVKCRGVAAGFLIAAQEFLSSSGGTAGFVDAFFQEDAARVNLRVISDGFIFAQKHLGVLSPVRLTFFSKEGVENVFHICGGDFSRESQANSKINF